MATSLSSKQESTGQQRPAAAQRPQPAIIVGVLLLIIGGVLITLGWDGASDLDYVQGQFPYLLSGSVPGLALIIIAMTILLLSVLRRDAQEREEQLEQLSASITELAAMLGPKDPYDPSVAGEYRPRPRVATNGSNGDAATAEIPRSATFEEGK